jgi:hypothetical protein
VGPGSIRRRKALIAGAGAGHHITGRVPLRDDLPPDSARKLPVARRPGPGFGAQPRVRLQPSPPDASLWERRKSAVQLFLNSWSIGHFGPISISESGHLFTKQLLCQLSYAGVL